MNKPGVQLDAKVLTCIDRAALKIFLTIVCMIFNSDGVIAKEAALPPRTPPSIGGVLDHVGISPTMGQQVPLHFEFVDAAGKRIDLRKCVAGRPTILQLVYFQCPMLCQLSRDGLMGTLATIGLKPGQDFSVITLSFDPREGPELSTGAKQLAIERCGQAAVDAGWHFLTGNQAAISALCDAVGFRYMFDEKTGQFAHAAGVFVLTPEGRMSRFLSGADYSPRSLRLALVEAGSGKIGNWTDQAMLLCYMYDPTTGKYGPAIMSLMRVAGAATVTMLAGGILVMIRRERTRNTTGQSAMSQARPRTTLD